MDLIRARTTVDVQLVVTVPATEVEQAGHEHPQGRPARRPMDPEHTDRSATPRTAKQPEGSQRTSSRFSREP